MNKKAQNYKESKLSFSEKIHKTIKETFAFCLALMFSLVIVGFGLFHQLPTVFIVVVVCTCLVLSIELLLVFFECEEDGVSENTNMKSRKNS